ncbi:MAG TPA: hypothetical protein VHL09_14080 [Dehalococcoidia bacterium]|nr:hypothetical protein [Dehalococcoidia bacterium]
MKKLAFLWIPALVLLTSTVAFAQGTPMITVREDPTVGRFLADAKGMTLYRYTRDTPNETVCYDQCATAWPPLIATGEVTAPPEATGTWSTTTRRDGSRQVTINGMPLYYFAQDMQPGDITGQGRNNVWYVVSPEGQVIGGPQPAAAAGSGGSAAAGSGGAAASGGALPRAGEPLLPLGAGIALAVALLGAGLWQRRR